MVIDQGTLLDSVEYNIEQTAVQMSDAVRELDIATTYVLLLSFHWFKRSQLTNLFVSYRLMISLHAHVLLFAKQISAKYRQTEMHFPVVTHHCRLDSRSRSETTTTE